MPKTLQLTVEKAGNLAYVTAQIVDGKGFPCFFDSCFISFRTEKCTLLAAGGADPASEENFRQNGARAWRGRAAAVLRLEKAAEQGIARVQARAEELDDAEMIL